jgi:hypothetical protein
MAILANLLLIGFALAIVAGSAHAANLQLKKGGGKQIDTFSGNNGHATRGDTYPTHRRAIEARGGAGNVAVAWDEDEEGKKSNRRFFCAEV